MPHATPAQITAFIARWENSGAAERANYQMFLSELCDVIGVPRPDPTSPDPAKNLYVFDRAITRINPDGSTSTNYIDLYKARHFVCETKQGLSADASPDELAKPSATKAGHGKRGTLAFDKALERAFHQGRGYITTLPADEGRPPFLIVCDVGHSIDLYAEFTCTGGQYERFPDPVSYRITLPDLHRPEIRECLRKVWTDPHALDPSKVAAKVTRDIAGRLALLAKSLEADGHDPQVIAGFLQRSLFTMFAEDVGLLPEDGFKSLLARVKESPRGFPVLISALWKEMATGTHYSALLFKEIACFNGGLFETTTALPLSAVQLDMLADAAATDWSGVEPSIFGTLLVRALDPRERHKLGAEFTPRSYVERLIRPTIIGPLRDEWDAVRIAAATLHDEADQADIQADQLAADAKAKMLTGASAEAKQLGADAARLRKDANKSDAEALAQVIAFHRYLCGITVLDPACGTANFLYVTMEHMKRLEAEVLQLIDALGGNAGMEMQGFRVRPEHFIGLEINKQAVAIAQLVLWIGYFQWQHKTTGKADTGDRPLLPKDRSIFEQDAVLAYDERVPRRDPDTGEILTVWDGRSTKPHPITGKEVPDESATIALFDYTNPRRAEWPKADYIVGNPPFIGASRMREALGDGYVESLRKAWKGDVPESADFVMFWWRKAAELVRDGKAKRFGFITTNSIHQTFNRRVIESFLEGRDRPPGGPVGAGPHVSKSRNASKPRNHPTQGADGHDHDAFRVHPSPTGPPGGRSLPMHLAYAIPDHPWIDSADGAAVRIAMTVAARGHAEGILERVLTEQARDDGENEVTLSRSGGVLAANLQAGADVTVVQSLQANAGIAAEGVKPHGMGFVLTEPERNHFLTAHSQLSQFIKPYKNGRDIVQNDRSVHIIDFHGLSEEEVLRAAPELYQHVKTHVKPDRDAKRHSTDGATYAKLWWLYGKTRAELRRSIVSLDRYIVTVKTAKHRIFLFLEGTALPDSKLIAIASSDPFVLATLSSSVHCTWTLKVGARLGVGNDPTYVVGSSFNKFPFPALEEGALKLRIRDLGERLDAHRKRQQELHPDLTLTGIYNVLQKIRAGEALNAKDKTIHDQGLVSVLKQLHDDLDAAVLEAYGWSDLKGSVGVPPASSSSYSQSGQDARAPLADILARGGPDAEAIEQQLLTRLVALNHERAAEEQRGLIRWLRPDFQAPATNDFSQQGKSSHKPPLQAEIGLATDEEPTPPLAAALAWPDTMAEQVLAVRKLLTSIGPDPEAGSAEFAEALAARFGRKNKKRTDQITGILATLKALGLLT